MSRLAFLSLVVLANVATAMDKGVYSSLIQKIENSIKTASDKGLRTSLKLRLADLQSDYARVLSLEEVEKNCDSCLGSKKLRASAISHYAEIKNALPQDESVRATLQLGHLYSLNGQLGESEAVFADVIKNNKRHPSKLVGESYAGLGEIQFHQGQFKKSKQNFEASLKYDISQKDQVNYRLAWCHYNLGAAKTSVRIAKKGLKSTTLSEDLKKDMSRDLATFIATVGVNEKSMDELLALSPESHRKANLFYLGQEADRLGQREGALMVWARYSTLGDVDDSESLEILMRTAQGLLDEGALTGSVETYQKFYAKFQSAGCAKDKACDEVKARSRSYVTNWIKKEKTNPSIQLQNALSIYVTNTPDDLEMLTWAGHVSKYNRKYAEAAKSYARAADKAKEQNQIKTMMTSLEAEAEMAEDSEDKNLQRLAYEHYLALAADGADADKIRYQLAYLDYNQKNFSKAAESFHKLAIGSKLDMGQRLQSAHLSLDAMSQDKTLSDTKEELIETNAKSYASIFKSEQKEFLTISRRAGVNQSVQIFSNGKMSEDAAKDSLTKLAAISMVGATDNEKLSIYKNRITMGEVAKDLNAVDQAALGILAMSTASAKDREYAMGRRLWVAEAQMNFDRAYSIAKAMELSELRTDNRHLKLALLADLSGRNSKKHYEDFIKTTTSRQKANLIRAKFIKDSSRPWSEISKFKTDMLSTPEIYADLLVEIYAKKSDDKELEKHLKTRSVRRTASGQILQGFLDMNEFYDYKKSVSKLKLRASPDSALKKSLKDRIQALNQTESRTKAALLGSTFRNQLHYLDLTSKEYKRLYMDIMGLPVPKGLKKAQVDQYRSLLEQQAQPFLKKSEAYADRRDSLWDESKDFKQMLTSAETIKGGRATLLAFELRSLQSLDSEKNYSGDLKDALASIPQPDAKEARELTMAVKSDPFNLEKIKELKDLEEVRGRSSMVAFLEARLISANQSGAKNSKGEAL